MVVLGCLVLGTGVAMLLTADLGSDGYSTLVNGVSKSTGISFLLANLLISLLFLWSRPYAASIQGWARSSRSWWSAGPSRS